MLFFFFFLSFSMSPFDLICSFGLVMAKQLIQQTCLMRCEACTQIQLSPTLCPHSCSALQLTGGRRHSPAQSRGQVEASLFEPETTEADQRSVIHDTLTSHPLAGSQLSMQSWCWDAGGIEQGTCVVYCVLIPFLFNSTAHFIAWSRKINYCCTLCS